MFTYDWKNFILNGAVGLLILTLVEMAFYNYMPMSYWLEYHDVTPVGFNEDGIPLFESDTTIRRASALTWNDILRCENGGDYIYYSNYMTQSDKIEPKERSTSVWAYQGLTPDHGECYLESQITLNLPYGFNKTQTVNGDMFSFND